MRRKVTKGSQLEPGPRLGSGTPAGPWDPGRLSWQLGQQQRAPGVAAATVAEVLPAPRCPLL